LRYIAFLRYSIASDYILQFFLCLLHRCRMPQEFHYTHIMSCSIELGDHKQKYRKRLAWNPFFLSRKLRVPQQLIVQKIAIDLRYT
jgi:hypothetical protein